MKTNRGPVAELAAGSIDSKYRRNHNMEITFKKLSAAQKAIVVGRARVYYAMVCPESVNGYRGVGVPRCTGDPPTFRDWSTSKFGIHPNQLYRHNATYRRIGEAHLANISGTNLDTVMMLQKLRKLNKMQRQKFITAYAVPLETFKTSVADLNAYVREQML